MSKFIRESCYSALLLILWVPAIDFLFSGSELFSSSGMGISTFPDSVSIPLAYSLPLLLALLPVVNFVARIPVLFLVQYGLYFLCLESSLLICNPSQPVYFITCLLLCGLPFYREDGFKDRDRLILSFAQFSLACILFTAGLTKLFPFYRLVWGDGTWISGVAFEDILRYSALVRPTLSDSIERLPTFVFKIGNWATLAVELGGLPLIFSPRTRGLWLLAVAVLFSGISIVMFIPQVTVPFVALALALFGLERLYPQLSSTPEVGNHQQTERIEA